MAPLHTSHWRRPVSCVALVAKGHDAVPALGGPLLQHRRRCGRVTVTLPWHRRYDIAVALTIIDVAVASPLHCSRAAVVLMQRQPMVGAGAQRPCSRSRRHCVAVGPSWSRRFDHCRRRGPRVVLLLRRRGHVARLAVAPPRCCVAVAPTPPPSRSRRGHRSYGVAVAPTIAAAADALPSRCRCVAVVLPSRPRGRGAEAPMLWVGPEPWHRRSWLCRRTRVVTCGRVAVAPSLSRCQRALVGNRCAYVPRAVPRCLFGLVGCPWL
jgi:hypothetical protein